MVSSCTFSYMHGLMIHVEVGSATRYIWFVVWMASGHCALELFFCLDCTNAVVFPRWRHVLCHIFANMVAPYEHLWQNSDARFWQSINIGRSDYRPPKLLYLLTVKDERRFWNGSGHHFFYVVYFCLVKATPFIRVCRWTVRGRRGALMGERKSWLRRTVYKGEEICTVKAARTSRWHQPFTAKIYNNNEQMHTCRSARIVLCSAITKSTP